MHGLVSLLPIPYYGQVQALWQELEEEHGLKSPRSMPFPHFSWQVARNYDQERLDALIKIVAEQGMAIELSTAGLGLFTGSNPVIYISIVKTLPLMRFHARLWELTGGLSQGRSHYYRPIAWMPHISLAWDDLANSRIAGVLARLCTRSLTWQMRIDNLAFIYNPAGQAAEVKFQYRFPG